MILITGGGGFVGLNIARGLVDKGQEVLLVRRHSFELPSFLAPYLDKEVKVALGDILDLAFLYRLIKEYNVDSIVHSATQQQSAGSLYQSLKVALVGITEVLEAARIFGLRRVTFISSGGVYQVIKTAQTLHEDMDLPVASGSGYVSAMRKAGEQICQLYAAECGLSVPIVRISGPWGPMYLSGRKPLQTIVENSVAGKPTDLSRVYGLGKSHYIYVRDCAKAINLVHLASSLKYDIYNVSDSEPHSLADFAKAIKEVIPEAQIKLGTTRSATDRDVPPMSIERIKEDVGFTPDYDLKRAVRADIDWVREGKYN